MRRFAGMVALVTGAVLAVAGSLRPLYEETLVEGGDVRTEYRVTSWGVEHTTPAGGVEFSSAPILYGVPMAVAAALLALAAVLVLVSAPQSARVAAVARAGAVVSAALLIGSVWTVGQIVVAIPRETDSPAGSIGIRVGLGFWMLVAACVVALAGGLLVQQRGAAVYQVPDDDDTDTPPMGVPIHPPVSTEESSPG